MKKYEIRLCVEGSDGEYRPSGDPVYHGDKQGAIAFISNYREENKDRFLFGPLEVEEVTYKKGNEVKRAVCNLSD